jgi:tetratricopeptide (TPR) repeat protein
MANEFKPYVGPRPFEKKHKELFFGRDDEVTELIALITAHREVLLYAQSGAGKTSLINAGLIPSLEKEEFEVLPVVRLRNFGLEQNRDVDEVANFYVYSALMNWVGDQIDLKRAKKMSLKDFLQTRISSMRGQEFGLFRVIIFDQFEELFTLFPERWREREGFFIQLSDALKNDPLLRAVFVIREDKLAQIDPFVPLLPEKLRTRFRLELLHDAAARMAIEMPIKKHTRRSFEEGVVERLVRELQKIRVTDVKGKMVEVDGEYVEPVQLQVVCQNLWSKIPAHMNVITRETIEAIYDQGGQYFGLSFVDQSLAEFFQNAIMKVVTQIQVNEGDLRKWFQTQFITPAGTRGIIQDMSGIPAMAVEMLEDEHLIRAIELRPGVRLYELIHDRLIDPILQSNEQYLQNKTNEVRDYYLKGTRYADQKQYEEAIQAFNKAIELDPDNNISYYERGRVCGTLKRYNEAIADFDKVIELDPSFISAYANKGFCLREMGRFDEAIHALDKVIELDPQDVWSYNERGRVHYVRKNYEKATADWSTAITLDPTYKWGHSNMSVALSALDRFHDAVIAADKAIEIDPKYVDAWRNKGLALEKLGRHDEAISCYDKAIEIDPKYVHAWGNKGLVLEKLGRHDEAISCYDKAIEIDPKYADPWNDKGSALDKVGRLDEAVTCYDKAIEIDPKYVHAWGNKGLALEKLGRHDEAISCYDKAIEIDPKYVHAWRNKGLVLEKLGRHDEAISCYDKAIEIDPKYADPWNDKGSALDKVGRLDEAVTCYDKAIEIDPKYIHAWGNKGLALDKLGRYDEAISCYDKAIEIDPKYIHAWDNKGLALEKLGRHDEAISCYDKAIEIDPGHKLAYSNKGGALIEEGRYDEALKAIDQALELDPQYAYAYYKRGLAYYYNGEYERAIENWDQAIESDPNYIDAFLGKGAALQKLRRFGESLHASNRALELDPNYVLALSNKGETLLLLDNKVEAYETFEKALGITQDLIKKNPNEKSFYQDMGWLYYLSNRFGESVDAIKKGLSFNPELANLDFLLGLVYLAQGNADLSKKAYKTGINKTNLLTSGKAFTKYKDAIEDLEELAFLKPETKKAAEKLKKSLELQKRKLFASNSLDR